MTRSAWVGMAIGVAILAGIYWFLYGPKNSAEILQAPLPETGDQTEFPDPTDAEPVIEHLLPEPDLDEKGKVEQLPELEDSDEIVGKTLRELFGAAPAESLLVPRDIVRRFVLTVDSLDREPLPLWLRPVRRVPGLFKVERELLPVVLEPNAESSQSPVERLTIDERNARRYAPLMALVDGLSVAKFATAYKRYYPLIQDSYDQLGNPRRRYFNDRFINVIDHLLSTPELELPIALVRPKVVYKFADPELEARSSGQKVLLRIGRSNARKVKAKLRELRREIATRPAG